jgi:hypothetical protein
MGATTQVTDFSDLYTDLMERVREDTSLTATKNLAKRWINTALHDMHIGFSDRFPWAERRAVLVTQPKYTTGTVAISKGGTALVGTDTLWATANDFSVNNMRVGGKVVIGGGEEVYEVTTVTDDTNAVIGSAFIDTTVTAASYVYFEDEYALASDFGRPIDAQTFIDNDEVRLIGRTEFRRNYPRNKTTNRPRVATIIDLPSSANTTPVRKVRLAPPPDEAYSFPYSYVTTNLVVSSSGTAKAQFTLDDDEPIVPLRYRHAIVFHALYCWYRDHKDDARSQEAKAEYTDIMLRVAGDSTDIMLRVAGDSEIGASRPQLQPRRGPYVIRARHPWSGNSGRYDINSRFDQLRDKW